MFPWLWLWAPQLHFPWSGDVAQDIEPTTTWTGSRGSNRTRCSDPALTLL